MRVTFCRRWNFLRHQPIGELTEVAARKADATGQPYAVGFGDPSDPELVLDIAWENAHLGVWFLDSRGRRSVHYAFTRAEDNRMFLAEMTHWEYTDDRARTLSQASKVEKLVYAPDGTAQHEVRDKLRDERRVTDIADVDVSTHWEPVPAFGDWESAARFDRSKVPGIDPNIALPSLG